MSETANLTSSPVSPLSLKRKPVPTPRSTLRKPSTLSTKLFFENESEQSSAKTINSGGSQGLTSNESRSPDDTESRSDDSTRKKPEEGDDILSALEKIPGVGSLRSLSSIGTNSFTVDRVKREDSSHSLGPSPTAHQFLERQRSVPTGTFHHTRRPWQIQQNQVLRIQPKFGGKSSTASSPNSSSPIDEEPFNESTVDSSTSTKTSPTSMQTDSTKNESSGESEKPKIQERPLPALPNRHEAIDVISTEQIYAALLTPEDHYCELNPQNSELAASVVRYNGKSLSSANCNSIKSFSSHKVVNGFVTLTGTIRRGRRRPQKTVDIQVTPDHLEVVEKRLHEKYNDRCYCGLRRGPHIFLLSILCLPLAWIFSTIQAFILGSMTLYNIFIYFNEERTCCHTLFSPIILLFYPIWIVPVTLLLGFYSALAQISWYWDSWIGELKNPDKGFMNWVCQKLNVPDCAPYQVVILSADESNIPTKPVEI